MSQTGSTKGTIPISEEALKADFRLFLFVVWRHLGLPDPTPVQLDIAWYMQHGPRRKMVQAFRGVGKSWIYAAFCCWRFFCDPQRKIMVVSASKVLADDFSKFVKRLIHEMPLLNHLRPREGQRDTNISFDVGPATASKDPSLKSVGITGQITGSRADEILADDIESLNNSSTEAAREKLSESVKEFDAVLKPNGIITFLGTPQSFMTMYSKLPERGYDLRIWPAQVPEDALAYNGRLAPFIEQMMVDGVPAGTPVDPKRFDEQDLAERRASYGKAGYALQFMLNTSASDALRFPLKLADLLIMNLDPRTAPQTVTWGPQPDTVVEGVQNFGLPGDRFYRPMATSKETGQYKGVVMYIDPSGRGQDETGVAIVGQLNGNLFVHTVKGFKGGYSDKTLSAIVKLAMRYKVTEVWAEDNFGDGMFIELLKPHFIKADYRVAIEGENVTGQKELRIIDSLEAPMMQHRLVVHEGLINEDYETSVNHDGVFDPTYSLFFQMTRLTTDKGALKHDDRLEALAGAVRHMNAALAQEQQKKLDQHREADLKWEVRRWKDSLKGKPLESRRNKGLKGRRKGSQVVGFGGTKL